MLYVQEGPRKRKLKIKNTNIKMYVACLNYSKLTFFYIFYYRIIIYNFTLSQLNETISNFRKCYFC